MLRSRQPVESEGIVGTWEQSCIKRLLQRQGQTGSTMGGKRGRCIHKEMHGRSKALTTLHIASGSIPVFA